MNIIPKREKRRVGEAIKQVI